ncbi:MAG: KH domain-containing protein [Acidobacteria bacterium]|nr:KH domain-containing protein [Acidobacteriota bacterium]MBI3264724.1 KH domain-containing protein [Acidobacteriota bacterium]
MTKPVHSHKLLEVLARHLVDAPELVRVDESEHRGITVLDVLVAPNDLGRMIGRQGRTADAVRTLVAAVAERDGQRVSVEFHELGGGY